AVRSEVRTRIKTAVRHAEAGAEDAAGALRTAVKRLDKAAAKGVIHPNQASNRKSRLMRRLAKLGQASPEARATAAPEKEKGASSD
ncbi:MAG TPA: 30S ribosomal protein S20, partial [Acidimicrobiales bacterium]|nr:30S ribosomal protein S20 [Acidimicrobiales bacterium]